MMDMSKCYTRHALDVTRRAFPENIFEVRGSTNPANRDAKRISADPRRPSLIVS